MWEELMIIITGTVGTLGFSFIMNLRRNRIIYVVIGGLVTSILYVAGMHYETNVFLINLIPTVVVTIYAEVMARVVKAPVTIFLIPSLIPLIPGGALYNTMLCILLSDQEGLKIYGKQTILIACAIAAGIVMVSTIMRQIFLFDGVRFKTKEK